MNKNDLEVALNAANELIVSQREELDDYGRRHDQSLERVETLTKQKADLLADLVQYRTATFRLHESNAALLTLINKHQV